VHRAARLTSLAHAKELLVPEVGHTLRLALFVVLAASLIEAAVLSLRGRYDWKAFGVSFVDLIARQVITIALPISLAAPLLRLVAAHPLMTIPLTSLQAFVVLFIGQEFFYYWHHRISHRVRWFWSNHAVHHSPNQFNFAAAYRLGLFGKLIGSTVFFLPLVWIGFPVNGVLATLSLNLLYQFWIHADWIPRLGVLEYVFNTPSAHRVHHAANVEYLDANYGGVLILFDRLFGTYVAERDDVPCRYGLVHPQTSYNPLRVELDQWTGLARDIAGAGSLKAALGYLVMPPGWRHDGPGETTAELRARARRPDVAQAIFSDRPPSTVSTAPVT
jgi:sterol desaturase/sphingolipid hydroxylase (fatty acid hydroxylase superfamily)